MVDLALLKKLCLANGVSGDEKSVRDIIIAEIKDFVTDIKIDALGNLIVFKKGKNSAKNKLMLSAHMDEVGFIVTDITEQGFIKFDEVGGVDRRIVLGNNVLINNKINGIVGIKPVHLCNNDEAKKIPSYSDMYIDIGACSKGEALEYVSYGDSVTFNSDYYENDISIQSKALDDRIGCLVMIEIIKQDLPYDMYFTFVTQEEVGLRGAKVASYTVNPDYALVIESTTAADLPEVPNSKQVCNVGEGAVVGFMDKRTVYSRKLIDTCVRICKEKDYKIQYKRAVAGGNDAGVIHSTRSGINTLAISVPARYLHSQLTLVSKSDIMDVFNLTYDLSCEIAGGIL